MRSIRIYILLLLFFSFVCGVQAQQNMETEQSVLFRSEKSGGFSVHTQGIGLHYRTGLYKTYHLKRMIELDFITMNHPKEVKSINPYFENAKSFKFGKLNTAALLRANVGHIKTLNEKPYWGGVEVRYLYFVGFSAAVLKPIYLSILYPTTIPYKYLVVDEKYDPEKHNSDLIYGRASFFKGFDKIKVYPGLDAKLGLSFEYGNRPEYVRSLEVGVAADMYLKEIPIMAFDNNNNYFLTFYVGLHFGKRKYF